MKNSSDTIGNRTRDLPACSAVPQPIATVYPQFIYNIYLHDIRKQRTCNVKYDI